MVRTRSHKISDISKIIDEKFEVFKKSVLAEFKKTILEELKKDIDLLVNEEKENISTYIQTKKTVPEKDLEFAASLEAVKQHVKSLQEDNYKLKVAHSKVVMELDDLQQYGRRPNLRIYGVPVEVNETAAMVEEKVKTILGNIGTDVPTTKPIKFDRAHRVGKPKVDQKGHKQQAIIVRFRTFRERTLVYKARKSIKERLKYGISLDLTKRRLKLLNEARDMVEDIPGIKFAYTDINCQTRIFTNTNKHIIFNSLEELENIVTDFY